MKWLLAKPRIFSDLPAFLDLNGIYKRKILKFRIELMFEHKNWAKPVFRRFPDEGVDFLTIIWKKRRSAFWRRSIRIFLKKITFKIIDSFESLKRNSKEIYNWSYGLFLWFWLIQFRLNLASVSKLKLFWPNKHCYGTLTSPNENNLRICDIIIVT